MSKNRFYFVTFTNKNVCPVVVEKWALAMAAINIRFERVSYEFSYFNVGDYKSIWLDQSEFDTDEFVNAKIGFR